MSECPTCRRETDGLNYVTGPYCSVGCWYVPALQCTYTLLEEVTSRAEAAERECDEARAEVVELHKMLAPEVVDEARAEIARLQAIVGSPDTYEALLYQNQEQALEIANLKRGIEAYREDGRWHLRCRDEGKPFHCKVCDWEHEQKEADRA